MLTTLFHDLFRGTFRKVVKTKSSDNFDGLPYISTLLSTSLWTFYGLLDPDDGVLIVTVNRVGVTSQIVYLAIYLFYATKARKMKYLGLVALDLIFLGIVMVVTLVAFDRETRRTFVGVLCAIFTIVMYGAPLSIVVKTLILVAIVNILFPGIVISSALQAFHGGSRDTFIGILCAAPLSVMVPNAIGILSGSAQIIIYMIYKNKSPVEKSVHAIDHEGDSIKAAEEGSIKIEELTNIQKAKNTNRSASMTEPSTEDSLRMFTRTAMSSGFVEVQKYRHVICHISNGEEVDNFMAKSSIVGKNDCKDSLIQELENKLLSEVVNSKEEAYNLYCAYAHAIGFSVRREEQYYHQGTKLIRTKS
ncbi:hypothetical protein ACH5RR_001567 [Cinchona calisaya]|uniref:Bidirectional sugar transporter SWEET n=1 Tax=Cinchona calisaya TaxID=153742 RepID=A0ABD3B417_9GENT